ncbi:hypothetical protein V8F20_011291 [Naviculisporaceae sp. PSN 640]
MARSKIPESQKRPPGPFKATLSQSSNRPDQQTPAEESNRSKSKKATDSFQSDEEDDTEDDTEDDEEDIPATPARPAEAKKRVTTSTGSTPSTPTTSSAGKAKSGRRPNGKYVTNYRYKNYTTTTTQRYNPRHDEDVDLDFLVLRAREPPNEPPNPTIEKMFKDWFSVNVRKEHEARELRVFKDRNHYLMPKLDDLRKDNPADYEALKARLEEIDRGLDERFGKKAPKTKFIGLDRYLDEWNAAQAAAKEAKRLRENQGDEVATPGSHKQVKKPSSSRGKRKTADRAPLAPVEPEETTEELTEDLESYTEATETRKPKRRARKE